MHLLQDKEERAEEGRQREEEARALKEDEAKGEAQWAVVREKLQQEREVRKQLRFRLNAPSPQMKF